MATRTATPPVPDRSVPEGHRPTPPIVWWAIVGYVCLAFVAYLAIAWVTGPYFEPVPSGPSEPPAWMKAILVTWQVVGILAAVAIIGWFGVRPWLRERRITFDGLLAISCFLVVWQDPLSSYFNHWYTYNSWLVNMGSWVKEVPGWMSYSEPGAMDVEPIIWTPFCTCTCSSAPRCSDAG